MNKKYIVRLMDEERERLEGIVKKLAGGPEQAVALEIVDSISHTTVRQTLKKTV